MTTGYAYTTLALGVVLSFVTAAILAALVDPAVTFYRDRVRGRALQRSSTDFTEPQERGQLDILHQPR